MKLNLSTPILFLATLIFAAILLAGCADTDGQAIRPLGISQGPGDTTGIATEMPEKLAGVVTGSERTSVEKPIAVNCSEPDGGYAPFDASDCITEYDDGHSIEEIDHCGNIESLFEKVCPKYETSDASLKCTSVNKYCGGICAEYGKGNFGMCLFNENGHGYCECYPDSNCSDTDMGWNWEVKGTAKGIYYGPGEGTGEYGEKTDYCKDEGTLQEYFCNEGGFLSEEEFTCPDVSGCSDGACGKPPGGQSNKRPVMKAIIPLDNKQYVVGNECRSGKCCTFAGEQFEADDVYKSLPIGDPTIGSFDKNVLIDMSYDDEMADKARKDIEDAAGIIRRDANGALNIEVRFMNFFGTSGMGGGGKDCTLMPGKEMKEPLKKYVGINDDFIIYSKPRFDKISGGQVNMGSAGMMFWAGDVSSAPYATTNEPNSELYLHEWLHELDFALERVSYSPDIYSKGYPPCGEYQPDKTLWFPNPDHCTNYYGRVMGDPDYEQCGMNSCPNKPDYYTHMLREHYPKSVLLIGNYCRNGTMDFDEQGIDCGGEFCNPC
ncbi:MAG: hypothetical protein ABH854_03455 [Candidatus Diapherotrites archaeon]